VPDRSLPVIPSEGALPAGGTPAASTALGRGQGGGASDGTRRGTGDGSTVAPGGARLAPLRSFLVTEAGGAAVLLGATLLALLLANSPWSAAYHELWDTELAITLGGFELSHDLRDWVNDGLMSFFFLLIGLEVRREFDMGEFRERRRVAVPVIAAAGGMLLPVLIFLAINPGGEVARGWAMVMTTDTAFAIGILALAGRRCPLRLRSFLLTLVIVDDIAAVVVIALVYSSNLDLVALGIAGALLAATAIFRLRGIQRSSLYWALGLGAVLATWTAGVHPGVAGVLIGLMTSAYPPRRESLEAATGLARAFREAPTATLARQAARRISMSLSPNDRLQHSLHPWTSYVIVPVFALANAGLDLRSGLLGEALGTPLVLGIVVGLVAGKAFGISIGAWLATRPWLGGAPLAVGWPSLVSASTVAGIGFTMSLLIAELSYGGSTLDHAKLGILSASLVAATVGTALFRLLAASPAEWVRRSEAAVAPPVPDLTATVDPERDHVRGAIDAPVTLVEYGDFECPWCRRAAPHIRAILQQHDGRIRLVFRHLPLTDVHPNAALAAEAAEAAGAQGAFWPMHDLLFERQDALQLSDLVTYAGELGLDQARFEADLRSGRFSSRVSRDVNSAAESGVAGTPTYFINDVRYRGALDPAVVSAALDGAARGSPVRPAEAASSSAPSASASGSSDT
jgi:Na+/H+ antiporter NhaA